MKAAWSASRVPAVAIKAPQLIWFTRSPLCEGLSDEETAGLFELFEVVELPAGARLYAEDEVADALYVVLMGTVEVFRGGSAVTEVAPAMWAAVPTPPDP